MSAYSAQYFTVLYTIIYITDLDNVTENVTSALTLLMNDTVLSMVPQNASLKSCPITPPGLVGPIAVWFDMPTFKEIDELYPFLEPGGHGKPKNCRAQHRVAIIVPYRFDLLSFPFFVFRVSFALKLFWFGFSFGFYQEYATFQYEKLKLFPKLYAI